MIEKVFGKQCSREKIEGWLTSSHEIKSFNKVFVLVFFDLFVAVKFYIEVKKHFSLILFYVFEPI
jgi:hypothetical protein